MYEVRSVGELRIALPVNLHRALRMRAIKEGKTLKSFVVELLEKTLTTELIALYDQAEPV